MEEGSSTDFTACGKTHIFVIPFTVNVHGEPRRAARRGISLFLQLEQREIPHFVRNDKINHLFRGLFSLSAFLSRRAKSKPNRLRPVLLALASIALVSGP